MKHDIETFLLFGNGNCMCFDSNGEQMMHLQGNILEKASVLRAARPKEAFFAKWLGGDPRPIVPVGEIAPEWFFGRPSPDYDHAALKRTVDWLRDLRRTGATSSMTNGEACIILSALEARGLVEVEP